MHAHLCGYWLAILILSFGASSCASPLAQRLPDWAETGQSRDYPAERYMVGVGSGATLDAARDRARAELARQFSVKIEAALDTERASERVKTNAGVFMLDRESARELVRTKTEETLQGVQIPQIYADERRGQTFALAVLERGPAEERLMARLNELDRTIVAQLEVATAPAAELVSAFRALASARQPLRERAVVSSQLMVLSGGGQRRPSPIDPAALAEAMRKTLASIRVRVLATWPAEIESAVREAVSAVGLTITGEDGEAELSFKAELTVRATDRLRESGFIYSEGVLAVTLEPRASSQPALAGRYNAKDGGRTEPEATAKMLRRLHDRLLVELRKALDNYLTPKS